MLIKESPFSMLYHSRHLDRPQTRLGHVSLNGSGERANPVYYTPVRPLVWGVWVEKMNASLFQDLGGNACL